MANEKGIMGVWAKMWKPIKSPAKLPRDPSKGALICYIIASQEHRIEVLEQSVSRLQLGLFIVVGFFVSIIVTGKVALSWF